MSRIASTTVTCLMLAVAATASATVTQDYRPPDARPLAVAQDYRSPDARPVPVTQDFRSPDAKLVAGPHFAPPVPASTSSALGFGWRDLAVGIAMMLVALAGIVYINRRRRTLTAA